MSNVNVLRQLDSLIDFYETHKPHAGQRIIVELSPKDVSEMVGYFFPVDSEGKQIITREIPYRGRIIVATGRVK